MDFSLSAKQGLVLKSPATEILFGGAVSGGKSHLLRVIACSFALSVPNLQIFIFRRHSKELMLNHMVGANSLIAMLAKAVELGLCSYNGKYDQWRFKNGSTITLAHAQYDQDIHKYQGAEIQILLVDEATLFSEYQIRFIRSRVRRAVSVPKEYKDKLPFIVYGTNPRGVSHRYFKYQFVDFGAMVIHRAEKEEGGMLRQYIPARLEDNTIMCRNDPGYADRVRGLGKDGLIMSMLEGDWEMSDSRAMPSLSAQTHVLNISEKSIPAGWKLYRCFDYGYSSPSVAVWFAITNGESVLIDGEWRSLPRDSMVLFDEDHQREKLGVGLKLSIKKSAKRIKKIDDKYRGLVRPGPADASIFSTDRKTKTIAKKYEEYKVPWLRSNKAPGTRKIGLQLINDMIDEVLEPHPEAPCLYFTPNSLLTMTDFIALELEPEGDDVDTTSPHDHSYDGVRYAALFKAAQVRTMKITGH